MSTLHGKRILLGVSGGIAAYKAATVASLLVQDGARVEVIMTEAAQRFVQPLSFSAITHAAVHTDPFAPWTAEYRGHVSLARSADILIVAPATAATIARLSMGLADDFLGLVALSTRAPILVAPAMEDQMYQHPATEEHLSRLAGRGVIIVGPERGRLASGAFGDGRMASPESIVETVRVMLCRTRKLQNKKIVVTAGGTREPIDPVRYIGNRSSGRMGYALAKAALQAGADVTLISGPTNFPPPPGVTLVEVETTAEMHAAVGEATSTADALIMAAAVADFRPAKASKGKIKRSNDTQSMDLTLVANPDILTSLDQPRLLKVGFAAETSHIVENAALKLAAKGLDMIVANDAVATIGAADSEATILKKDGTIRSLPVLPKEVLATEIVAEIGDLLARSGLSEHNDS